MFLTRYNKFDFDDIWKDFDSLFANLPVDFTQMYNSNVREVHDNDAAYVSVRAPGYSREDITVDLDGDVLVVKGTPTTNTNSRNFPSFSEKFEYKWTLSSKHDKKRISAELKNGVLTVTVPFVVPYKPTETKVRIEIK